MCDGQKLIRQVTIKRAIFVVGSKKQIDKEKMNARTVFIRLVDERGGTGLLCCFGKFVLTSRFPLLRRESTDEKCSALI